MKKFIIAAAVLCVFSGSACRDYTHNTANDKRITKIIQDVTGHKEGDCMCLLQDIAQNGNEKSFSALMQIWEEELDPELPVLIASALYNLKFKNEEMKTQLASLEGMEETQKLFSKALKVASSPKFIEQGEKAEEQRQKESREKELEAEKLKELEYKLFESSVKAVQEKKEAKIRDILLKHRPRFVTELDCKNSPMQGYATCFARGVLNEDEQAFGITHALMKEGIMPERFIVVLAEEAKFKTRNQLLAKALNDASWGNKKPIAAQLLCEFWNNQDLFSQLIRESTQNGGRCFRFLNYLLFENNPNPDGILACFNSDFFDRNWTNDPFSIYENTFKRILTEARRGNERCLEQLFCLRYDAMVDPEHYGKFWEIVKVDKNLMDAIIKHKLLYYKVNGIKVPAEYPMF